MKENLFQIPSVRTLRIRELREKNGYTRKKLADKIGINPSLIELYETRSAFPPNDVLYAMCKIFSVSYEEIVGMIPTGYPSVDRPWKKYYDEAAFSAVMPNCSIYKMVYENNKDRLKEGAIANMVDLRLAGKKLADYINSVHSDVVVCSDVFAHNIAEIQDLVKVKHFIVLTPFDSMAAPVRTVLKLKNKRPAVKEIRNRLSWADFIKNAKGVVADDYPADSDDVICIFHTSGTTAMPKSVMMTNGNMNALGFCYQYVPFDIQDGDRFLSNVPPFLVYNTIFTVHMPLVRRMTVVMLPIAPMSEFADIIMKYKPNHVGGSAAGWREFPKNPATETADLSFLKACCSGNDSLALETKLEVDEILRKGGCPYGVMEGYGMTEAGSAIASCWPAMEVKNSIGVPLWINIISIFDPDDCDRELTYNEVGEICVYGPSVMAGYYDDEKATKDVLRLHLKMFQTMILKMPSQHRSNSDEHLTL